MDGNGWQERLKIAVIIERKYKGEKKRKLECSNCGEHFMKGTSLSGHMLKHVNEGREDCGEDGNEGKERKLGLSLWLKKRD